MNQQPYSPEQLLNIKAEIDALDLGPIRFKLLDHEDGEGWDRDLVDRTEVWYRRYLFLSAKVHGTGRSIVPNRLIDEFWHQHILDTQKYADDCERMFGWFLHHFPYFGVRGGDDAIKLESAFRETLDLFVAEYGESPVIDDARSRSEWETQDAENRAFALSASAHCANACTSPCEGYTIGARWDRPTA